MGHYQTIAERILAVAAKRKDAIAITLPARDISYDTLAGLTRAYARRLRKLGIGRGALVGIDVDNPAISTALTLACALLGCPWVHATAPARRDGKITITHLVHGPDKQHPPSPTTFLVTPDWAQAADPGEDLAQLGFEGPVDDAAPWMIAQSSGTTGTAKFMAISHANLDAGLIRGFGLADDDKLVACFLAKATLTRQNQIVRVLLNGGRLVCGEDLPFLLSSGVTRLSGSPAQYAQVLRNGFPKSAKKITFATVAGGRPSEKVLEVMLAAFERVQIRYGSTEVGILCERDVSAGELDPGNVGRVEDASQIEIVDENDTPVAAGTEGIVRTRSIRMVDGYIGDPEATAQCFRHGWFYPGDRGFLSGEGDLNIIGRVNDQLNIGGEKINAASLDAVIARLDGVKDGMCFRDPGADEIDRLAVIFSLKEGAKRPDVVQELFRRMVDAGLYYKVKHIYLADNVPRNAAGKLVRHLALDAVSGLKPVVVDFSKTR